MENYTIRNRVLTNEELETLRIQPQYLGLNKSEFVLYNLVQKETNLGLFKNERMLVLNIKNESLSYLSKVPHGLIPFHNYEQVMSLHPKQIIFQSQIFQDNMNKLSFKELPDKCGIEIKLIKKDKKVEWVYYFYNKQLMEEWSKHLNFLFTKAREEINQVYHFIEKIPESDTKKNQQIQLKQSKKQQIHDSPVKQGLEQQKRIDQANERKNTQLLKKSRNSDSFKQKQNQVINNIQSEQVKSNVSELQKKQEKESLYNDFEQNTPLGSFIRSKENSHSKQANKNKDDSIHNPSEEKEQEKNKNGQIKYQNETLIRRVQEIKRRTTQIEPLKDQVSEFKGLQYQFKGTIEKQSSKNPQSRNNIKMQNKEDSYNHRFGSIKKNSRSNTSSLNINKINLNCKQWNKLYYNQKQNKSEIYFEFTDQCVKKVTDLVNHLPSNENFLNETDKMGYPQLIQNGIVYKIAFRRDKQQSLIYNLVSDQPIVFDMYAYYQSLKSQFYANKQQFSTSTQQRVPLSVFIQYKQIAVFCRADNLQQDTNTLNLPVMQKALKIQEQILQKMENAELFITSTADFREEMRRSNISHLNWSFLYNKTNNFFFKKIFLAEIYCSIFLNILRCQLFQIYNNFPAEQFHNPNTNNIQMIITDCALHLVSCLFGEEKETENLWDTIIKQTDRIYKIKGKRDEIHQNYLLYAILFNSGMHNINNNIQIKDKYSSLIKHLINKQQSMIIFKPIVHCLEYQQMSPKFKEINTILKDHNNFQQNNELLRLRDQISDQIPKYIDYLIKEINLKLSSTIPFKSKGIGSDVYDILRTNQPSFYLFETAVSKVKWLLKQNAIEAGQLVYKTIEELIFYIGKNSMISRFYQTIALHQFKVGEIQKGVINYRHSIEYLSEILGSISPVVFHRRNRLSDLYFQMNKRQECLKQLLECKKISENNKLTNEPHYVKILIKISKITLAMSKFNDSINNSLDCLKFLQKTANTEGQVQKAESAFEFLKVSELLMRSFELGKRKQQIYQVVNLSIQRCKHVDSLKVYIKLFKLTLFPYLKRLTLIEAQSLLAIVLELSKLYKDSGYVLQDLVGWIKVRRLLQDVGQKIPNYFHNLKNLYEKIIKQRLLEDFRSRYEDYLQDMQNKSQSLSMLTDLFLITNLVDPTYIQAMLKDVYYQ